MQKLKRFALLKKLNVKKEKQIIDTNDSQTAANSLKPTSKAANMQHMKRRKND